MKKALARAKAKGADADQLDDTTELKKALKIKEVEAESAEEPSAFKMTVKQRIAKNKKALKINNEVTDAKEAILDEKHKVAEAIENESLKKKAVEDAEEAESEVAEKAAEKAKKRSLIKEAVEEAEADNKALKKEITEEPKKALKKEIKEIKEIKALKKAKKALKGDSDSDEEEENTIKSLNKEKEDTLKTMKKEALKSELPDELTLKKAALKDEAEDDLPANLGKKSKKVEQVPKTGSEAAAEPIDESYGHDKKELMDKKHHELHQKNKKKHASKKAKKNKKVEANDLSQAVSAEKIKEPYGKPNAKPSKYEKKLRSIFTEMSDCSYVALKNIENHSEVLTQTPKEAIASASSGDLTNDQMFKMVKHPDQKKYMHYALQNAEGQWLQWDKSGAVSTGPHLSWLAMLPVNENEYKESGWLIK